MWRIDWRHPSERRTLLFALRTVNIAFVLIEKERGTFQFTFHS
jgi:hypothetical protein